MSAAVSMGHKRKTLSKRLRFEIFKRDGFRCLYCGVTPEQKVLRVDHVQPVVDGGTNDPHNLATSCFDCNAGKGPVPLEHRKHAPSSSVADAREHADQIKAYLAAQREIVDSKNGLCAIAEEHWEKSVGWTLTNQQRASFVRFIARIGVQDVLRAIDVAAARVPAQSGYQSSKTFAYFCGVCWKQIKAAESTSEGREESRPIARAIDETVLGDEQDDESLDDEDDDDEYAWEGVGWGDTLHPLTVGEISNMVAEPNRWVLFVRVDDPNIVSTRTHCTRALKSVADDCGWSVVLPFILGAGVPMADGRRTPGARAFFDTAAIRLLLDDEIVSIPWRALDCIDELGVVDGTKQTVRRWKFDKRSYFARLTEVPLAGAK